MPIDTVELISLLVLGLFAGAVGGLVGVGGSIIIIPVLTIILVRDQHLSQATAMIVNVLIAVPSVWQHHKARAVRWDVVGLMLPVGIVFIIAGVEVSNRIDGASLKMLFGAFLLYIMVFEMVEFFDDRSRAAEPARPPKPMATWQRVGFVGTLMGFLAGLLGIGGGPVAVPLLYRVCKLPLRQSIAISAAVMCVTALIGAIRKNWAIASMTTADGEALSVVDSLWTAGAMAPGAVIGAMIGASLTHSLPLRWVRAAFVVLVGWACLEMLGVV